MRAVAKNPVERVKNMCPIAGAAFLPHPPILIPEIGNGEEGFASETQVGFQKVIEDIKETKPDVLILFTPHGSATHHLLAVNDSYEYNGNFATFGVPRLAMKVYSDESLRKMIMTFGKEKGLSMTSNRIKLDHGALVPLYFLQKAGIRLPMVHLSVGWADLHEAYEAGMKLGSMLEACEKKVLILASGDLSHRLKETGPYGFHPKGPVFDQKIKDAFDNNHLTSLLDIDTDLIEAAGQCGLIPFLIASGMLASLNVNTTCHSYQSPYGVGYLCGFAKISKESRQKHHPAVLLAKATIQQYVEEHSVLDLATFKKDFSNNPFIARAANVKAGAFVSIHSKGRLRGCIGTIESVHDNLLAEIVANAIEAATRDPRFQPIEAHELDQLEIKVDEMGPLESVSSKRDLDVQMYGVVVESGYRRGLLLPALEGVEDVDHQIAIACSKAGIGLSENYHIYRFKVTRYQ